MIVEFTAYGRPAPQGSKVQAGTYMKESSVYLPAWRKAVSKAAALARIEAGLDMPGLDEALALTTIFAVTATQLLDPPDLDKLIRAVGDACKDGGLIRDDSLIVRIDEAEKCRPGTLSAGDTPAPLMAGVYVRLRTTTNPFG